MAKAFRKEALVQKIFMVPYEDLQELKLYSGKLGISESELIRQAVKEKLEKLRVSKSESRR